jgi:hypothetical protein
MNPTEPALRIYRGVVAATIGRAQRLPFASVSIVGVGFSCLAPLQSKCINAKVSWSPIKKSTIFSTSVFEKYQQDWWVQGAYITMVDNDGV